MAGFYRKKRRKPSGPNKNELKVLKQRQAQSVSSLHDRFPGVGRLVLKFDFVTPQQDILDQQTRTFGPNDAYDDSAACAGRCGGAGVFNIDDKIAETVNTRRARAEGQAVCQAPIVGSVSDPCAFVLKCKIDVTYLEGA